MPQTNRVDPRAKKLKDHYAAINQAPRLAKQSPLIAQSTLERLNAALQIPSEDLAVNPDEQVRQIGKALVLAVFVAEYKKETRDTALLQGWLFFWYAYLDPISPTQPAPSIANVIAFCSDASNLRAFLHDAKRWVNTAYANDLESLRALHALLSQENFGKIVLSGLPRRPSDSERRTFGNYLNAAARVLALRVESLVPEFFEPEGLPSEEIIETSAARVDDSALTNGKEIIHVSPPEQVMWVAQWMASFGSHLPGLGTHNLSHAAFMERPLTFQKLRGQPRAPAFLTGADAEAKGMSGFVSGVLGSGRTALLKSLTRRYALQFLRQPNGILAFSLSARDFVLYARNRRSIHDFIADTLASYGGETPNIEELPNMLRMLDRAGKLLVCVDDLDRLSDIEQSEVWAQLTFSPAVIAAVLPWQVERLTRLSPRAQIGLVSLKSLAEQEQRALLEHIAVETETVYDRRTAEALLRELPSLAQTPLGVLVLLDQLAHAWTDATQVAAAALDEWCRRAGLPLPSFEDGAAALTNEWMHLQTAAYDLLLTLHQGTGYERLNGQCDVTIVPAMVENQHGYKWQMNWEQVGRTGLFHPVPHPSGEGLALIYRDLTSYILAHAAQRYDFVFQMRGRALHPQAVAILEQAMRHLANLKNPQRGLDIRHLTPLPRAQPPPPKPKTKRWHGLFPELFRALS